MEEPRRFNYLGGQTASEFRAKAFKEFGYAPFPFQEKVHLSDAKFRVIAAAARIGKTFMAAAEAKARMLYPIPQTIWCIGPTYAIARKVFREIWDYINTPEGKKLFPTKVAKRDDMEIVLFNGTIIEGKSADNPPSLLGEGVDLMIVDEASRISDHIFSRYLITRLTTNDGDLVLISTPHGINTAFHKYYLQGKDPDVGHVESWTGTVFDNPLISKRAIDFLIANKDLDPIGYEQEVLGRFVAHEGAVFPTFKEEDFFMDVPYNPDLPVEASIDHGFRNPFACLFFQRNGHQVRVIKEYYVSGKCDLDHVEALKPVFEGLNIKRCVVDPREPNTRLIFAKTIPSCAFVPGPAKEIPLGIQIIRDHLKIDSETKTPYIVFDQNNCKKLLWEFLQAHYKKGEHEVPEDKDNHALSALRYYMLQYCNFLNRTELSHFMSSMKTTESFFSEESNLNEMDLNDRPWMGKGYE
jgi:phage terminase large subunit